MGSDSNRHESKLYNLYDNNRKKLLGLDSPTVKLLLRYSSIGNFPALLVVVVTTVIVELGESQPRGTLTGNKP